MNTNAASLDRLHDIVVPAPVAWWPPAPGWYWVIGFILLLAVIRALQWFARWQRNRYRREALAELHQHELALHDPVRRAAALAAVAELLKRTALAAFPREQVATLTGPAWFQFLDRTARTASFAQGVGAALEQAAYDPRSAAALDEPKLRQIASQVRTWITDHRNVESPDTKKTKKDAPSTPSLPSFPSVKNPSVKNPSVQNSC